MKKCANCKTDTTPQWYSGSICKSCYRKQHRKQNLEHYKLRDSNNYNKNKDRTLERQAKYYQNNKEKCKERSRKNFQEKGAQHKDPEYRKKYYLKNKEKLKARSTAWQQNNRQKTREHGIAYNKRYPEYRAFMAAKRRAQKLKATPKWADLKKIELFYEKCPKGFEIDHIVPLKGRNVCGLHILKNLQYLTSSENRKKSNKI